MFTNYKINNAIANLFVWIIILLLFSGGYGITGYQSEKLAVVCLFFPLGIRFFNIAKGIKANYTIVWMWIIILLYLFINYEKSYSKDAMAPYLLRMIFFLLFVSIYIRKEYILLILKYAEYFLVIVALVYIVCYPLAGQDAGIYHNYQNTALNLSLGLGIFIPKLFVNGKFNIKYIGIIGLLFLAISITGKRMFFVIPIVLLVVYYMISKDNHKHEKFFTIIVLGVIALVIVFNLSPTLAYSLKRLIDTANDSTFSYRTYFWKYAIDIWKENRIFGIGFGCFSEHIRTAEVNLENYGYIEAYDAHNIYYQLLAETGLIGVTIFILFFGIVLIKSIKVIRKVKMNEELLYLSHVAMYFELWFVLYGFTGNPLYMPGQLFALMFGNSIITTIEHLLKGYEFKKI